MLFQLTEQPRLGAISISGDTLSYAPGNKTGTDKFSYTAVDSSGNAAKPAPITIQVIKNRAKLTYADMEGNPAHFAAIQLAQAGVMTGEQIGECAFFHPTQTVTRNEFIAMAAVVADLPITDTTQTDFADDSGLSSWAKPFVSTAAANGLISGYPTSGGLPEIRGQKTITLAEACVIVNNMLSETLDDAAYTIAEEHSLGLDWMETAIGGLYQLEALPTLALGQQPNTPVTRQTACELLYQAMRFMNE